MPHVLPFDRPPTNRPHRVATSAALQPFLNDVQILLLQSPLTFRTLAALVHRLAQKHRARANDH